VIFDPYKAGDAIRHQPVTEPADIVVVSHNHADHNHVAEIAGHPQVISGPGMHSAALIVFRGIAVKHDTAGGAQRGDNTIFCAEIDRVRLCHLGDLGHELEPSTVAEIGPVDVLMCPVGGTYTIDAKAATQVVKALNPRITIPMHYLTPKLNMPLAKLDGFLVGKQNVRRAPGPEIELTADKLPADPIIVALEPAL
jgi:L-ascorbate metabolism protein UlaG (beta-lactamase superfamily)